MQHESSQIIRQQARRIPARRRPYQKGEAEKAAEKAAADAELAAKQAEVEARHAQEQ